MGRGLFWGLMALGVSLTGVHSQNGPVAPPPNAPTVAAGSVSSGGDHTPLPAGFTSTLAAPTPCVSEPLRANPGSCFGASAGPIAGESTAAKLVREGTPIVQRLAGDIFSRATGSAAPGAPGLSQFDPATSCGAGRVAMTTACPDIPEGDLSVPACDALKDRARGTLDPAQLTNATRRFTEARTAACCQTSKLATGAQQLSCLNTAMLGVAQELGQRQQCFQRQETDFRRAFANAQQLQADMASRQTEIERRLNGDGEDSLTKVRDDVQTALRLLQGKEDSNFADGIYNGNRDAVSMTGGSAAEQAQAALDQMNRDRTAFPALVAQTQMQYTRECVTNLKSEGYRCPGVTGSVTFSQYLGCLAGQQNRYERGGTETSSTRSREAETRDATGVTKLLGRILNEMPGGTGSATPSAAGDPSEGDAKEARQAQAVANNASALMTPNAVFEEYGADLRSLNRGRVDVAGMFRQALDSCHARSGARVQRELSQPGRPLAQEQERMRQNELRLNNKLTQELNISGRLLERVNRALTSGHAAAGLGACINSNAQGKISCLNQATTLLQNQLNGAGQAPQSIPIPGRIRGLPLNVQCSGLDGCIRSMKNLKTDLATQSTQLTAQMDTKKQEFNQGLETALAAAGAQLRERIGPMLAGMTSLNGVMQQMGVEMPSDNYPPVALEDGPEGIKSTPRDIVAFLGGQGQPPMPDFGRGGLGRAIASVGAKRTELGRKAVNFNNLLMQLNEKAQSCRAEFESAAAARLERRINALVDACGARLNYCNSNGSADNALVENARRALNATDPRVSNSSIDDEGTTGTVDSGSSELCTDEQLAPEREIECHRALHRQSRVSGYYRCPPATPSTTPATPSAPVVTSCPRDQRVGDESREKPAECANIQLPTEMPPQPPAGSGGQGRRTSTPNCAGLSRDVRVDHGKLQEARRDGTGTARSNR